MGRFRSTKTFENLGTAEDSAEISRKKYWISEMRTVQPKILEIPGAK